MDYDLVVIGGGAAGIGAVRAAVRRRARVLLVQDGPIGGDCTFTGCVPSKAVLAAAARGASFVHAMAAARAAIGRVAATEDDDTFERLGVDVVHARARFTSPREIDFDGRAVRARSFVIATGSSPAVPPIPGLPDVPFLTNESVFGLERAPRRLVVLGGGPIGCELGQALRRLGVEVAIIEALDRLIPREEPDASKVVEHVLQAEGVDVQTNTSLRTVDRANGCLHLSLSTGSTFDTDALLIAVGRAPATADLGLARAGVRTDERGWIVVDDRMRTSTRGIYSAGDVTGGLQFTHVANDMGRIAAENALRRLPVYRFKRNAVPWVTFTDPEVAHVGATEQNATRLKGARICVQPMAAVDRGLITGRTEGFVKLVVAPKRFTRNLAGGRVIGATIVAPGAGEMIHEVALAVRTGMFAGRLAQTIHAYPTWSVAVRQAAAQLFMDVDGRHAGPPDSWPITEGARLTDEPEAGP